MGSSLLPWASCHAEELLPKYRGNIGSYFGTGLQNAHLPQHEELKYEKIKIGRGKKKQSYQSRCGSVKDYVCGLRQLTFRHLNDLTSRGQSRVFVVLKVANTEGSSASTKYAGHEEVDLQKFVSVQMIPPSSQLSKTSRFRKAGGSDVDGKLMTAASMIRPYLPLTWWSSREQ